MNNELNKIDKYILASNKSIILANLINSLITLLLIVISFFGIIRPIYYNAYQSKKDEEISLNKEKILEIGKDSHLIYYNNKTNAISNVDGLYKIFVYQNIKYCYEKYAEIYKEDLDNVGYLTKKDFFKDVKENDYLNNDLAYFMTTYIIDKVDKNNNKILEVLDNDYKKYFIDTFIDINNTGSNFFTFDGDYNTLPRLNIDTCRYLFQYNVMKSNYSTLRNVDNEFSNYFTKLYKTAGDYLLKYKDYNDSFYRYEKLYNTKSNNLLGLIFLSYIISISISELLIPLVNKKSRTIGEYIFKLSRLNQDKSFNKITILKNYLLAFIKHFYLLFFIIFIEGSLNLLTFKFLVLGNLTISFLHIISLFIILSSISLILKLSSKTQRSLGERIFKFRYYQETIS